jgi:hypothetical protein
MVMAEKPEIVMRYTGSGTFIPDVPARDLTDDDLAVLKEADTQAATVHAETVRALPKDTEPPETPPRRDRRWLQKSGLYEPVDVPAKKE